MLTKSALGVGHAGHAAVQTVQHHGAKHADGRLHKLAFHGHHNGIKAPKQRRQGKEVGKYVNAFAALAHQYGTLALCCRIQSIVHFSPPASIPSVYAAPHLALL